MIGSFVGWSWDNAVEMIPVHSNPTPFSGKLPGSRLEQQ